MCVCICLFYKKKVLYTSIKLLYIFSLTTWVTQIDL